MATIDLKDAYYSRICKDMPMQRYAVAIYIDDIIAID